MRTTNRRLEALAAVLADDRLDAWAFATPEEQFAALKASGTTLSELAAGTVRPLPAQDPDLWRILRRSELRRSFGLQAKHCLRDDDRYSCRCGEVVFDEIDDADAIALAVLSRDERRRELLRRSKPHHIRPPRPPRELRRLRPQPPEHLDQEVEPEPESHPAESPVENGREGSLPSPPVRVAKHFPRWYDEAEHPRFSDMKF
jgi:hypothetical protein